MDVGKIFSRGWPIVDISRGSQKIIPAAGKNGNISFSHIETEKKTFFAKHLTAIYQILKSRETKAPLATPYRRP